MPANKLAFFSRKSIIQGQTFLILSAVCSFNVALVHLAAIFIGPAAYRLLGAGENFAALAEAGSIFPALVTLGLVGLFTIFGCYALSGAGILRRLPLLVPCLLGIAAIYTLRGVLLFVEIGLTLASQIPLSTLNNMYSTISLIIGLLHFIGIKTNWHFLHTKA